MTDGTCLESLPSLWPKNDTQNFQDEEHGNKINRKGGFF